MITIKHDKLTIISLLVVAIAISLLFVNRMSEDMPMDIEGPFTLEGVMKKCTYSWIRGSGKRSLKEIKRKM